MTTSRLRHAAIGLAGAVLLWPAAAQAATVSAPAAGDPHTTFTVNGAAVTVSSTNPKVLRRFSGHPVAVICEAGAALFSESDNGDTPQLPINVSIVGDKATWAAGAQSVTVTLPQDVSERVDVCAIASFDDVTDDSGPVAAFTAAGRDQISSDRQDAADQAAAAKTTRQLMVAYRAAKAAARRNGGRFGSARAVARSIRARKPKLRVRVAATPERAKRRGVVYVIDRGTGGRRLLLAERDSRGRLHMLTFMPAEPIVF